MVRRTGYSSRGFVFRPPPVVGREAVLNDHVSARAGSIPQEMDALRRKIYRLESARRLGWSQSLLATFDRASQRRFKRALHPARHIQMLTKTAPQKKDSL